MRASWGWSSQPPPSYPPEAENVPVYDASPGAAYYTLTAPNNLNITHWGHELNSWSLLTSLQIIKDNGDVIATYGFSDTLISGVTSLAPDTTQSSSGSSYSVTHSTSTTVAEDGPTYTLAPEDIGANMSVQVSFVDDGGTTEVLTSPDFQAVSQVLGVVTLSGTEAQFSTLTATLVDDNGFNPANVTWSWHKQDGEALAGATSPTYPSHNHMLVSCSMHGHSTLMIWGR